MSRITPLAIVFCLLPGAASAAKLQPVNVTQFVLSPQQAAVLRWQVEPGSLGPKLECQVRDFADQPVQQLQASVAATGAVEVTACLASGYYDFEFAATQQRFGVVVLPEPSGQADPFFSIDTALSWLVEPKGPRTEVIQNLRRCGIAMARERLSWSQINPSRGRWEWDSSRRYETVRQTYKAQGVEMLEMFHDAPGWLGHINGKYPNDLVAATQAWQEIGRRWQPSWNALEIWNEPDIFFGGNLPADQYVPLIKALAWGLREAQIRTPLVGGVLAHDNVRYLDNLAANGTLDCVEIFSFHTYDRALAMEALVGRYREWLKTHGHEGLPLWLTECGRPWKRGPDRPPVAEDAESSLDIAMKAIEARACGVARYFAFVYPFYEENEANFGMLDRSGVPLRSMAAYARAAQVLAGKRYIGDLSCADPAVKRLRVFSDDRETVAVLYTGAATGSKPVKLAVAAQRVAGLDGRALPLAAGGAIPTPDGLAYVWLDGKSLGEQLRTKTTAAELSSSARQAVAKPAPASPIVLRYQYDSALVEPQSQGYRVKAETPGELPLMIRIFNLSPQAQELTLRLDSLSAESRKVTAPAAGSVDATWQLNISQAFARNGQLRIKVTAATAAGEPRAALVLDLAGNATFEQILNRYPKHRRITLTDLAAWRESIVGHGRMTMQKTADEHWQLKATFGAGDRWVYPILKLPADIDLSRFTGLAIRARCEKPAKVRALLHEGEAGVVYLTPDSLIPADGLWHSAVVSFRSLAPSGANAPDPNQHLDLDQVKRISLGLNSDSRENQLEVSDLILLQHE